MGFSRKQTAARGSLTTLTIGWYNFRQSLATNLRAMGVDVVVPGSIA
jgi:hypothetical protein